MYIIAPHTTTLTHSQMILIYIFILALIIVPTTQISSVEPVNNSSLLLAAPSGLPTIKEILHGLESTIDDIINQAENAGWDLEIQAGREISIAIQDAEIAFVNILDLTLNEVGKAVRDLINTMQTMVNDIENNIVTDLNQFYKEVNQLIVFMVEITGGRPQVTNVRPKYIVTNSNTSTVQITGIFPLEPVLILGSSLYMPTGFTNQEVIFNLPLKSSTPNCTFISAKMVSPYETGIFKLKKNADFDIWLGVLPVNPGKITVYYSGTSVQTNRQHYTSPSIHAWGDPYYPEKQHWLNYVTYPDAGWTVDTSTVSIHDDGGDHGDHGSPQFTCQDPSQVCTQVSVCASDGKHMGRVNFHVEFDEVQQVYVPYTRTEQVTLKWGDSIVMTPASNEQIVKIAFDSFTGHHREFAGPSLDDPFLKIKVDGAQFILMMQVPTDFQPE